jgi:dipeptidase E
MTRLLLFSNSTNAGEPYLDYTLPYIREFLGNNKIHALFIPYAGVTITWDKYLEQVANKLKLAGIKLSSIHQQQDCIKAVREAEMIIIGGGNTFHLLKALQDNKLLEPIRNRVNEGMPYIGWSAGSNMACPTIRTTNDMPVAEPRDFNALGLVPFQINPHYTDAIDVNHAGETREMRIEEFIALNKKTFVAGLREGTLFHIENNTISLKGKKACRIFYHGQSAYELNPGDDFSSLIQ